MRSELLNHTKECESNPVGQKAAGEESEAGVNYGRVCLRSVLRRRAVSGGSACRSGTTRRKAIQNALGEAAPTDAVVVLPCSQVRNRLAGRSKIGGAV